MAFDLTRTRYFRTREVPVAAGHDIAVEGAVLKQIRESGLEHAAYTEGGTSEVIIGFSENNALVKGQDIETETVKVPASGTLSLKHAGIVAGSVWVRNATAGADLTVVTGTPANATEIQLVAVQGQLVNTALAGATLQVRYKYNLSAIEQEMKYGARPVNMKSNSALGTITVIAGSGEIYTDQFDTSKDFSRAAKLYAGAKGVVTTDAAAGTEIPGARVLSVPTAADAFLGFTFNLA